MNDDDPSVCNVAVFDDERGILTVNVEVPDELVRDDETRMIFCDGVAAGVAALANELWPVA